MVTGCGLFAKLATLCWNVGRELLQTEGFRACLQSVRLRHQERGNSTVRSRFIRQVLRRYWIAVLQKIERHFKHSRRFLKCLKRSLSELKYLSTPHL